MRVEEGTRQHVIVGRLRERGAEFEAWLQPRTLRRREDVLVHVTPTGESNPAATSYSWWQKDRLWDTLGCRVETAI